ncbi:replication initiator [Catenuloplanes indicus]|uniref:Replication initiation protein n=1 Tax=Catenuloplanes indicus TaxID=137267 RepID=A0AAE3W470_9ACTN|nr:replication initiator [Catenuloplanes indicus]MDQ0368982.1 hypothetical protein [Catenuloplanes indicus]
MHHDHPDQPFIDRDIVDAATHPDFRAWLARMRHIGGCANPVHLIGRTITVEPRTGRLLDVLDSDHHPHGRLTISCGNSRASRCEPCARLHQGDTYQLVVSGLAGGKSVPTSVREHPRVFVTFTAPSFGSVHRHTTDRPCRPRRDAPICPHGRPLSCTLHHATDAAENGTPLCPDCYDYESAVLFNAHTRDLWQRLHRNLYEHLASVRGISRTKMRKTIRISYAKVAEYQRRGAVHFHAIMRFDGPTGPTDAPPAWATTILLTDTIRTATRRVAFHVPGTAVTLKFGKQLDVRPIHPSPTGDELTERAVASYIAKYVTKPDLSGITVDRPVEHASMIPALRLTEHSRKLLWTCWLLASRPQHQDLKLRRWSHQLGYRGHTATKSRAYSTTYTALRDARADHQQGENARRTADKDVLRYKNWIYSHTGHTEGQAIFADGVAEDLRVSREAARTAHDIGAVENSRARR